MNEQRDAMGAETKNNNENSSKFKIFEILKQNFSKKIVATM